MHSSINMYIPSPTPLFNHLSAYTSIIPASTYSWFAPPPALFFKEWGGVNFNYLPQKGGL